ncbi:MAG: DUF421 domain-containing protein [Verrucomicrobiota bacterium]|nr:DUF421 domain-containing protein [Verrucomicrobiota bacterium]
MSTAAAILFDGWYPIQRTLICGALAYTGLIILLRISGKRTLSKWNAFDFAVTVAFGSTIASILLSKDVSLVQGLIALSLLVLLQYIVTWLSVRSQWFSRAVKAEPSLLLYRGNFQRDTMRRQRVTEGEVLGALRENGITAVQDAAAVVLESDGSFSVVAEMSEKGTDTLRNVVGFHEQQTDKADQPPGAGRR